MGGEWAAALAAVEALASQEEEDEETDESVSHDSGCHVLACEMRRLPCFLLMEYVPGTPLLSSPAAFASPLPLLLVVRELGCLFMLDMLLGNADRLPCASLGWRGNTGNLLFGAPGEEAAACWGRGVLGCVCGGGGGVLG